MERSITTAPLDEAVLDELRSAMSARSFTELTSTFLSQLDLVGERFAAAVKASDRRAAEHAAHELVGIAGTMGAGALEIAARDALVRCRTDGADLSGSVALLTSAGRSAAAAFPGYLRSSSG